MIAGGSPFRRTCTDSKNVYYTEIECFQLRRCDRARVSGLSKKSKVASCMPLVLRAPECCLSFCSLDFLFRPFGRGLATCSSRSGRAVGDRLALCLKEDSAYVRLVFDGGGSLRLAVGQVCRSPCRGKDARAGLIAGEKGLAVRVFVELSSGVL